MEDRTVVAQGCRKTKKLIFFLEGGNIVAYGHHAFPLCTTINQGYVEAFGLFNLNLIGLIETFKNI